MPYSLYCRARAVMRQRFGVVPLQESLPDVADWLETPLHRLAQRRFLPDVADWLETPLGQAVLEQERMLLEQELQDLFGYHLLQMSVDPALDLTRGSRITHRFTLSPTRATKGPLSRSEERRVGTE